MTEPAAQIPQLHSSPPSASDAKALLLWIIVQLAALLASATRLPLWSSFPRPAEALAADVMLVTALRDGMNLVAKEYVTARSEDDGALVLSEFAGAADQLKQALLVNPHDIDGLKSSILRAIKLDPKEARRRMKLMRKQILDHDVDHWSADFLAALKEKVVRDDS